MTVILTPITSEATGAITVPEYTPDGCRIERPAIPNHENCAICTKRQQVQSMKGETVAVEWIFRNEVGAAVNLTIITGTEATAESESSLSASLAVIEETFKVKARFSECDRTGDILEVSGKIIDILRGVVQFKVPPQFACDSGVYKMQVAMVRDSDNVPVLINTALWSVEEGLWGDTSKRSGVPPLAEIRMHIRDTGVENDLLDDVEFDDEEIVHAIVRPVNQWNEIPPPVAPFTCRTFPFRYHWLQAIVGQLLMTGAHHYMRNNLPVNHAGLEGNFKDKYNEYLAVAKMYNDEWTEFVTTKKVSINAEMAYGSQGSPYSRSQW